MPESDIAIAPWVERLSLLCLAGSLVAIVAASLGIVGVDLGLSIVVAVVAIALTSLMGFWVILSYVVLVASGRKRLLGRAMDGRMGPPAVLAGVAGVAGVIAGIGALGTGRTPAPATPECPTRLLDRALGEYVCASPNEFHQAQLSTQMFMCSVLAGALALLALFAAAIAAAMRQDAS